MFITVRRFMALLFLLALLSALALADQPQPLQFQLTCDPAVCPEPFTGRVFVFLSRRAMTQPKPGPEWFNTEPFYAVDVKDWKPGQTVTIGANALGFPMKLSELPKGRWFIMAVMDFDRGSPNVGNAEGNVFSRVVEADLDPATSGPLRLHLDQVVRPRPFIESERVKLVEIESKHLSAFHSQPIKMRAGVVLPESFAAQPDKRYPILFDIPGFGGRHYGAMAAVRRNPTAIADVEMLYVIPDPACRWGHSVFADSDNNGPWGKAFIEELVPAIEQRFRAIGKPTARFVTGYSSGGWSSLWLQVTYPDFFGGVWSLAPDPVDFRDFQRVNIYEDANMFTDAQGNPRPLARRSGMPILFYKSFSDMEEVMGHGGQLGSFEAVFSPRGPDGRPRKLWDRRSGRIDPEVAQTWKRYDIRLILETRWPELAPKLAGKIHVYMGAEDTFYLDGATRLLQESLRRLGSDAVVEIFPGRDHGNLLDRDLRQRLHSEMANQFSRGESN
ncbi:MAG: alpha/beta hydrolase-fold protein [Gemmatales bacterium]|nr:alpha/beta hydrolase-fold protein [Gemmatales bacterium]MDW8388216.1 alpha/beta hydrolase-fold protein [Gemmatales bacterium]